MVSLTPCFPDFATVAPVSCLRAGSFGLTSTLALAGTLAATFERNTVLIFRTYTQLFIHSNRNNITEVVHGTVPKQ